MCGISGIFDIKGRRSIDRSIIDKMNRVLHHRGPDESGLYLDKGIALGHRRLSIIDLASGKQPLTNEDNDVIVVFNGEIYNYKSLQSELESLGHIFRTNSDTEVIVHGWEEWGRQCVQRFRGMFAFAIWDCKKETLFLARDRLGIKPLYYSITACGLLLFASEIKALVEHPSFDKNIDHLAVDEYFAYGYIPEPRSIFRNTHKLPPGHTLLIRRGNDIQKTSEYWNLRFSPDTSINESECQDQLIDRLREAVEIRLISEVPLGAFLSGGVDSSAVVAMMATCSDDPVNTCSISFLESGFDESEYAQKVAKLYSSNHHTECVSANDFLLLDRLSEIYDEPYADSSALPTYRVCELAKKHVTVCLSGDGGDEVLAGYRRYRRHLLEDRIRGFIPDLIRRPLFGALARFYPKADWAPRVFRAKATFECMSRDTVEGYYHSISIVGDEIRKKLYSERFRRSIDGYRPVEVLYRHAESAPSHPLSLVQYLDIKTYLVGDILTKVDRASMANSLEVRVPFLDHKFVEWLATIPPEMKVRGGEGKYILKKACQQYLPYDVLYRRKMGFAVPLARWFRQELSGHIQKALHDECLLDLGILDQDFISNAIVHHQKGLCDNSALLWSLLMFSSFSKRLLHGEQQ